MLRPRSSRAWTVVVGLLAAGCSSGVDGPDPTSRIECSLPRNFVFDGGVGRNGIPALLNPELVAPLSANAAYLTDDDRVIGIVVDGEAIAVPHNILWWHEIVNLDFASVRLSVTYCPLTGSSMVFDRSAIGGTGFIVSGLIFDNNLMMLDLPSESLWPQMSRAARCGPRDGATLAMWPSLELTWAGWKALHPDTRVVSANTTFERDYTVYPYGNYEVAQNPSTLFPGSNLDTRRPPKERVLGIPDGTGGIALPHGALDAAGAANAVHVTVGADPMVVFWDADAAGAAAYRPLASGGALTFELSGGRIVDAETGSVWRVDGLATEGPLAGERLEPVPDAYTAFWFAWANFQPTTLLWENGS